MNERFSQGIRQSPHNPNAGESSARLATFPFLQRYQKTWINSAHRYNGTWGEVLHEQGYVQDSGVYWSPARQRLDKGPEDIHPSFTERPNNWTWECTGYGMNPGVGGGHEYDFINGNAQAPLRQGESRAPQASNMILFAESYSKHPSLIGSRHGFYTITPGNGGGTAEEGRLYSYNGAVVRSYVDGSATAPRPVGRGLTGYSGYVGNWGSVMTRREGIGWDPSDDTPDASMSGPYAGNWQFLLHSDYRHHTPWFTQWRDAWFKGLRDTSNP